MSNSPPPCPVSCDVGADPLGPRDERAQIAERIRVQELLRYLQPYSADDIGKPKIATDTTLTVFAQLSALKLDCQRSFISLISNSKQYIIAEASRTVSIKSEDTYDGDDDAIYLGQTILDFNWGVCPGTIECFSATDDSRDITTEHIQASRRHYVMNDMSKMDGFKDRPYIAGWPYMKYYAEVPIHSPSGLPIGTLCVVDNKPREGLDLKGLSVLQEISEAVMNHLELCASKIQRDNAERMIHALGQFVQGNDSVSGWWKETQSSRVTRPGLRHLSIEEQAKIEFGASVKAERYGHGSSSTGLRVLDVTTPDENQGSDRPRPNGVRTHSSRNESAKDAEDRNADSNKEKVEDDSAEIKIEGQSAKAPSTNSHLQVFEGLFARASNLIREGIGLSGVVFFDPRSSDGTLLSNLTNKEGRKGFSEMPNTFPDFTQTNPPIASQSLRHDMTNYNDSKLCRIIGSSISSEVEPGSLEICLHEDILQYILQSFPSGGVLHFDEEGLIGQSNSVFSWDTVSNETVDTSKAVPREHDILVPAEDDQKLDMLRQTFPGVTSMILFPLWDTSHDKSFAYSMAWTTNPNRMFRREDFAYLASFGNSIMAEKSKLDTVNSDNAKTGFISSISHELRSPLHGIMASVELLQELDLHPASDLIRTIESCGSTLLETMENLLSFAKVQRIHSAAEIGQTRKRDPSKLVDLAVLVEDVMSICIASYCFQRRASTSKPEIDDGSIPGNYLPPVTVICDIDPTCRFLFRTDVGVWKRVLLNLLANSLKYTSEGFICVKLSRENATKSDKSITDGEASLHTQFGSLDIGNGAAPETTRSASDTDLSVGHNQEDSEDDERLGSSCNVVLSVEDSGRGISKDYMTHHLFKPFRQESSMNPGTGLGLAIVSQLVSSINGYTTVTSEPGIGTRVCIDSFLREAGGDELGTVPQASRLPFSKIGMLGLNSIPHLEESPSRTLGAAAKCGLAVSSALASYAKHWGLSVVTVDTVDSSDVDLVIITEKECASLQQQGYNMGDRPLLVLAAKPAIDAVSTLGLPEHVVFIPQPFGPRRFRQALETCAAALEKLEALPACSKPFAKCTDPSLDSVPQNEASITAQEQVILPIRASPTSERRDARILLVEDNPINLKVLVNASKRMSRSYATATNGREALQVYQAAYASNEPIDVIFMDIQMPIMNGMESTRAIRAFEGEQGIGRGARHGNRTFIIALTALSSYEAEREALDAGVDRYLSKPVSIKKMKEVVEEFYETQR